MGNCCASTDTPKESTKELSKPLSKYDENYSKYSLNQIFNEKILKDNDIRLVTSSYYQNEIKDINCLNELLEKSKILKIKIISENSEKSADYDICINPLGMIGSIRNANDGYTYFGLNDNRSFINNNEVDYELQYKSLENQVFDIKNFGRHFQIEFKIDNYMYYIRDLGIGFGTFIKLDFPLILKDNHLIQIGESFIVVNILDGNNPIESKANEQIQYHMYQNLQLKLKIFGSSNNGETYFFPAKMDLITIGRNKNCNLQILDKLLSKFHCTIKFNKKDGWTILDGCDNQYSTNGTWLYVNEDFEIYDKLIFKANNMIFQCFI